MVQHNSLHTTYISYTLNSQPWSHQKLKSLNRELNSKSLQRFGMFYFNALTRPIRQFDSYECKIVKR